jgi:sigma-B regulation protein RsbU (phosphoserine phosphatase)
MKVSRSRLGRIFQQQTLYLAVAAVVAAVFWAMGQEINPVTIILYSLLLGNMGKSATQALWRLYWGRPFPYNWLLFALTLSVLVLPICLITTTIVWFIAHPSPRPLWDYVANGWKFPALVFVVFSFVEFAYRSMQERLKQHNLELQRTVEVGSAQLIEQEQELQRAREIQQSLLPKEIPQLAGFEIAAAWRPARAVSGDYFDVLALGEDKVGLCIADVVGKGVSAALLMANVQAAVRAFAGESQRPADLCTKVNRLLCENIATGKFVTFFYGLLDRESRTLRYCNAGHLSPVLVSSGQFSALQESGAVLGVFPDWKYEENLVELEPGDRVVLFTDGVSEASDAEGQEFGETRVGEVALLSSAAPAAAMISSIMNAASSFCGSQFHDDATVLAVSAV